MKFRDYTEAAKRTESIKQPLNREVVSITGLTDRLDHALEGTTDERLELFQALLKYEELKHSPKQDEMEKAIINVIEECGDILWFTAIGIDALTDMKYDEMINKLMNFEQLEVYLEMVKKVYPDYSLLTSYIRDINNSEGIYEATDRIIHFLQETTITTTKRLEIISDNTPINIAKGAKFYYKPITAFEILKVFLDNLILVRSVLREFDKSIYEVMEINIKKLKKRYPDKFTEKDAINRDTSSEAEVIREELKK